MALPICTRSRPTPCSPTPCAKSSGTSGTLVTRLSELLQHCQFVLQQQTDQRLRQLTVLSAIFMPLTLITGVYGMNFAYMPETGWRYGYYATLAGMVWLAIFLWITLKRKGWFR